MIDNLQCQTHTRTPWGSSPHRYDSRLRYLTIGLLCTTFFAVIIVGLVFLGNKAMTQYHHNTLTSNNAVSSSSMVGLPFTNSTAQVMNSSKHHGTNTRIRRYQLLDGAQLTRLF
ncbi:hypothetical protein PT974_00250 [Cladobotryum mycophilum]|uniref:Uncharacterized protein n=1 Tax=Cladobotryum mycophilum TaxID=491253 RepID=A0ABR0T0J3_9HYPO